MKLTIASVEIIIRGVRWWMIIASLQKIPLSFAFHSTNIGLMLNTILPFRPGDLFKVVSVAEVNSIPYSKAVPAILFERFLDTIVLYIFFVLSAFFLERVLLNQLLFLVS